ncbi:MAG: TolC family protein [Gammaproteobacteria bacterium]|nr:TolC family protein [Gammaproteobacteria bacterium]
MTMTRTPSGTGTALAAVLVFSAAATLPAAAASLDDPWGTAREVAANPSRYAQPSPGTACDTRATSGPLDLVSAVTLALCNNPQTRVAWANALAQAAQVGTARAPYLPTVTADGSYDRSRTTGNRAQTSASGGDWVNSGDVSANVSYLLYDFGARAANLRSAQELLNAANAIQDSTVQSVISSTVQAYYQVQGALASVAAARTSEQTSLESLQAAQTRRQVGVATPAEVLLAQTAYSQSTLVRVRAEGLSSQARGNLAAVLGLDANAPLELLPMSEEPPRADVDQRVGELISAARLRRPDLAAAEAQYRAAQADVELARASGRPSLSAGVTTNHLMPEGFPSSTASTLGVTLSVPVFTGFSTTYRVANARALAEAKAAQRDQVNLQVAYDVWSSYQSLVTASQALRSTSDLLASATQSQEVAMGRYKAGAGSLLDLLTAQSSLAVARQARVQSLYDWSTSRVALALAMGALDAATVRDLAPAGPSPSSPTQSSSAP